ncbi:hypothetical protein GTV32_14585 [Gordonia sp. SID5947]|uniref:phage tail tape measure protein n=1 Tax=Gordonia sp. SID5947 TaxID=2690315 RepID=UPI001369DC58|nr:phage tail tape measure protein [Gordonia sp. SID5947]MYR07455.1 hypothetical protein [Gordonia sp. SID5947]
MAQKVADLYADLSIRGDDFDDRLTASKRSLDQLGKAADSSSEQVRQSAVKSANAYERVRTETEKAASAARTAGQKAADAAEREKIAVDRLAQAQKKYGDSSAESVRAQQRVTEAHRDTERATKAAEKAADQHTVTLKRASTAATQAAQDMRRANQQIDTATPDGSKLDGFMSKLGSLGEKGSEVGGNFGGSFMAGFAPKIASLGSKGGPIGAAVAGVAVVGLAAGALLAKSIADGMDREQMQDTIQGQLGVDEATASKMGAAASEAYMSAFGESVQGNMESLRGLFDFGLIDTSATQEDMEALIAKVEALNTALGSDTTDTLRGVSGLVRSGLVANIDEAADLIVKARQNGLNAQGDLLDSLSEYSAGWKNTGLSAKTALALVDQSQTLGVDNTDRAADALREFGRRVTEEGGTIVDALNGIGLNGQQMYDAFKEGGPAAEQAFDQAFDKIRSIEDPVKRNQAAMALLGDTAGDFIGAFTQWDPSKAVNDFGEVAGAADNASKVMNDNAASSIESLRRTIGESTGEVKKAMAEALGPTVQDMANGLIANKDEITAFFADVVSAALTFGIAMGNTAAGFLHVWGSTAGELGKLLGQMVSGIGSATSFIGGIISKIPSLGSVGNAIKSAGDAAKSMGTDMQGMGDAAHGAANFIADELVPGMAGARDRVNEAGDAARNSAGAMDTLRNSVVQIPDAKTIIISDNSPETRKKLEDLGFIVTTLPDGTVKVVANTDEAKARLADITKTETKTVKIFYDDPDGPNYRTPQQRAINRTAIQADGGVRQYASGGIDGALPDQAVIQPARGPRGLIQWAETAAGPWEAYIPGAASKRPRATSILSEVAGRFGFKLYRAMADGGISTPGLTTTDQQSMWDAIHGKFPAAQMTSGTRTEQTEGHADYHNAGKAIDISGGDMGAIATWIAQNYPDSLELIHSPFGHNIKDGKNVGDGIAFYGADQMAAHADHVHWALGHTATKAAVAQAKRYDPSKLTSKQRNIDEIVAEGQRRGKSEKEIRSAVMAALAESNAEDLDHGDRDSVGAFQQRPSQGWGNAQELQDTTIAAGKYYDALDKVQGKDSMTEAQMAQAVQRSAFSDGSNYQAKAAEADKELAASIGRLAAGSDGPADGTAPAGVQQVYVTNWPSGMTATTATPTAPAPKAAVTPKADGEQFVITTPTMNGRAPIVRTFANGGLEDHSAQIVRPGDYRVWGEPESGGESYIPHSPSKRARSLGIWAKTGRILGVKGFARGGFGGYTADTSDAAAPKNLYDLLSLGVGSGLMVANTAAPYVTSAQSGNWTLGDLAPNVNTGANDIPGVSAAVRQQTEVLNDILTAIKQGKNITVKIQGDPNGSAGFNFTRAGM